MNGNGELEQPCLYCGEDDLGIGLRFQVETVFVYFSPSRLALGTTQPTVQWVSEVLFFPGVKPTPQFSAEGSMPSSVGT